MRVLLLGLAIGFLFAQGVQAQPETAHHRKVYAEINAALPNMEKRKASLVEDELHFELEAWSDDSGVRKILSMVPNEDGNGSEEYFYENGQPIFVFRQYRNAAPQNTLGKLIEDRFYFRDGQMMKWIGEDKRIIEPGSEEFLLEEARLLSSASNFLAAFGENRTAPSAEGTDLATGEVEGVFLGIEQGDYAHWQMRDDHGEEFSFFILRVDGELDRVLQKPKAFEGRRCRVEWRRTPVVIPEAGGEIEIEQVIGVQWL